MKRGESTSQPSQSAYLAALSLLQATVSESSARHFTLREHGVEFVRSDARLRGWLAKEDTDLYVLAAALYLSMLARMHTRRAYAAEHSGSSVRSKSMSSNTLSRASYGSAILRVSRTAHEPSCPRLYTGTQRRTPAMPTPSTGTLLTTPLMCMPIIYVLVDRDLDEVAVCNLRTHDGLTRYYNAWIPRARVDTDPLGVLLPNTVDPGVLNR